MRECNAVAIDARTHAPALACSSRTAAATRRRQQVGEHGGRFLRFGGRDVHSRDDAAAAGMRHQRHELAQLVKRRVLRVRHVVNRDLPEAALVHGRVRLSQQAIRDQSNAQLQSSPHSLPSQLVERRRTT